MLLALDMASERDSPQFGTGRRRTAVAVTDVTDLIVDVAKQLEALNCKALAIKCDVTNLEQIEAMADQVQEKFGKINILS